MDNKTIENLNKAGQIAKQTVEYGKSMVKKDMKLLEIAEKIESKIIELGGKPAFPVNLSMNETAAHATPLWNEQETAKGLLKVDIGVHINGEIADTAFTIDLENNEENQDLIRTSQEALANAIKIIKNKKTNTKIREIGKAIEDTIKNNKFQPIQNLSGHSIEKNEIHAGISIPNYDNAQEKKLEPGVYAIEPFSTTGLGSVQDGKPSTIYNITKEGNVRDSFAREVLQYINKEYSTMPFCTRWLVKKFGTRAIIAMQRLEEASLVHQYPQLIEKGKGKVAQAEHTIILLEDQVIVTTE